MRGMKLDHRSQPSLSSRYHQVTEKWKFAEVTPMWEESNTLKSNMGRGWGYCWCGRHSVWRVFIILSRRDVESRVEGDGRGRRKLQVRPGSISPRVYTTIGVGRSQNEHKGWSQPQCCLHGGAEKETLCELPEVSLCHSPSVWCWAVSNSFRLGLMHRFCDIRHTRHLK